MAAREKLRAATCPEGRRRVGRNDSAGLTAWIIFVTSVVAVGVLWGLVGLLTL